MREVSEDAVIGQLVESLSNTYGGVPPSEVAQTVHSALARFDGKPIREFIPLLVERRARTELAQRQSALMFSS